MGKHDKYFVKPFDWGERDLVHHKMKGGVSDIGPLHAFLNKKMVEGADLNVFVHYMDIKPGEAPDYVAVHTHDVSQAYVFPTEGLKFEVILGDEKYTVDSPATVFIPPGLKHNLKMLEGKGIEVCILRTGWYE